MKLSGSEEPTLYDFAVLDATWSGIAQGSDAVQIFLATDGLGALLDNLNKGALPLQPVLLTIIAGEWLRFVSSWLQAVKLLFCCAVCLLSSLVLRLPSRAV